MDFMRTSKSLGGNGCVNDDPGSFMTSESKTRSMDLIHNCGQYNRGSLVS